jgi:hypothetical protein
LTDRIKQRKFEAQNADDVLTLLGDESARKDSAA